MMAKRSLGQNFLVNRQYQQRIVAALSTVPGETVVEIGPGHGALTQWLLEGGVRVVAVEADRELIPSLEARFESRVDFHLINADALKVDYCRLIAPAATARVIANLPYNISTAILQHLIDHRQCLPEMVVMLQREVVERIGAKPGGKDYGYFSVLVQLYCQVERLFDVPKGAFRPIPKVHSSVVRLKVRETPSELVEDEALFVMLAQIIFAQRRKTILNNLRAGIERLSLASTELLNLGDSGLDLQRRAETLSIAEIAQLATWIKNLKGHDHG